MTIEAFWQAVSRRLDAGQRVFAALVVANTRGSPGTVGARMLVASDGTAEGTIGGGIMETNVIALARERLADASPRPPELQELEHRKKPGTQHPSGLICAGEQTNLNLQLEPARDGETIRRFGDAVANQDRSAAILTIDADGIHLAQAGDADPAPALALEREGDAWHYRESSVNPQRLAIVGGGHCGKALARLASDVGYWVDVFDTRADLLAGEGWPPEVRRHAIADYAGIAARLHHPSLTTVVVMTTAVTLDIAALQSVATLPLRWLGVMGSAAKIHEIRAQLHAGGMSQARIDAIHGPIGLPMKSDTPPEIAISIMAQLLAEPGPHRAPQEAAQ